MKFAAVLALAALCASIILVNAGCAEAQAQAQADTRTGRGCADVCPAVWEPVCAVRGSNRRTFGNNCELARYNCRSKPQYVKVSNCECIP